MASLALPPATGDPQPLLLENLPNEVLGRVIKMLVGGSPNRRQRWAVLQSLKDLSQVNHHFRELTLAELFRGAAIKRPRLINHKEPPSQLECEVLHTEYVGTMETLSSSKGVLEAIRSLSISVDLVVPERLGDATTKAALTIIDILVGMPKLEQLILAHEQDLDFDDCAEIASAFASRRPVLHTVKAATLPTVKGGEHLIAAFPEVETLHIDIHSKSGICDLPSLMSSFFAASQFVRLRHLEMSCMSWGNYKPWRLAHIGMLANLSPNIEELSIIGCLQCPDYSLEVLSSAAATSLAPCHAIKHLSLPDWVRYGRNLDREARKEMSLAIFRECSTLEHIRLSGATFRPLHDEGGNVIAVKITEESPGLGLLL